MKTKAKNTDLTCLKKDPVLKDHFWINPFAKHFSTIKASDLVLVDSEGYVTEGGNQAVINEAGFIIHSEIHKARPDVISAAHTHGVYGKTWSTFGKPIEMISQGMYNASPRLKVFLYQHVLRNSLLMFESLYI